MIKTKSYLFVLLFFSLFANAQEEIDSSLWELVIPIEINDARPQLSNIVNLSRKDFLSMAASFDDPSRLLTKYPGFSGDNDQNNAIIYHGMPGYMAGWTLYGAEILNPNHLNTAGNVNDQYSPSAGGVNAFSGQVIGEYSFRANPDVNTSNDYFAGVSNIKMRTPYENQITLNTSLIGMEAGIDLKSEKADFLINARYSTVGLLTSLGLDFGGELINYADISAKLGIELFGGKANFYGIHGTSSNFKEAVSVMDAIDLIDASFKDHHSKLFITGFNYEKETKKGLFETTTNYSVEDQLLLLSNPFRSYSSNFNYSMLSHSSSYSHYFDNWDIELNYRSKVFINQNTFTPLGENLNQRISHYNVFSKYHINNLWNFQFGLSLMSTNINYGFALDNRERLNPSFGLSKISKNFNRITRFKCSRSQQLGTRPNIQYADNKITSSYNFLYEMEFNKKGVVANLFYHYFDNVYQNPGTVENYVVFDDFHNFQSFSFGDYGTATARIYGFSISKSQKLNDKMSFKINSTFTKGFQKSQVNLFNTEPPVYINIEIPYSLRFNTNVLFSCKDFFIKRLDFSLSATTRDGKKVKEGGSFSDPYTQRLPHFFRADTRLNYHFKRKKKKYSSMLSLDIQNLTGRKNVSDQYYDRILQENVFQEQLGFIPILSWRVVI